MGSWALAGAAVFVPVGHLVLVPAALIGGVVMTVRRAREDARLLAVRGGCPRCGAAFDLHPGGRARDGRAFHCPSCRHDVTLELADGAGAGPPASP